MKKEKLTHTNATTKNSTGITLIALVITIVVLLILAGISIATLGNKGLINTTKYSAFAAKIRGYQDSVEAYVLKEHLDGGNVDKKINVTDKEEIKKIIPQISDEDAEKYVIQDGELRYNADAVTNQEKDWLVQLGILVMTAITLFTITYMNNGATYQTIQSETIVFPEIDPTSSNGNFAGWYYEQEGTTQAVEGTALDKDITLYAKWESYTATFIVDGVTYATTNGTSLTFPATNPTKSDYEFMGWYYDESYSSPAKVGDELTKNTTIYSKWLTLEKKIYIIGPTDGSGGDDGFPYGYYIDESFYCVNPVSGSSYGPQAAMFSEENSLYVTKVIINYPGQSECELVSATGVFEGASLDSDGNVVLATPFLNFENDSGFVGTFSVRAISQDKCIIYKLESNCTYVYCLAEGTLVTLADRSKKAIEDVSYADKLLVWDFDHGCFAEAKPLWIKRKQVAEEYNLVKFDNGVELKTVADHRIFNMESQKFTYTMNEEDTPIGTTTFMEDGTTAKLVERKVVKETVNYYNIITEYHMNLFANGILTSLRLNNLYKIENMKFVKDNRSLASREEYKNIPDKYFYGLRLEEQPKEVNRGNDVKHTNTLEEYVERIMKLEMPDIKG